MQCASQVAVLLTLSRRLTRTKFEVRHKVLLNVLFNVNTWQLATAEPHSQLNAVGCKQTVASKRYRRVYRRSADVLGDDVITQMPSADHRSSRCHSDNISNNV